MTDSEASSSEGNARSFTRELLRDLQALERLVRSGAIESDVSRVGAEQELFLVDRDWMPAPWSAELLAEIDDPHFTTELARYNLEINLDPVTLRGEGLRQLAAQLDERIAAAEEAARARGGAVVMTGILPTLSMAHASLDYMTPRPRYRRLNEAMGRFRGGPYSLRIRGRDELILSHDNVMLEACNTSFQVHLQLSGSSFVKSYNVAQWIAAPVLAASANSPLLFDRQLWAETRIALFQQSTDSRRTALTQLRQQPARVSFGSRWLERSVVEAFEEDVARFRTLFSTPLGEDSLAVLSRGDVPELRALRQHNGTVYRWNRPCYGISEGKPHLRIECRYLPSGPTVADEIANAALWLGLMRGAEARYGDPSSLVPFGVARNNFLSAARTGLAAQFDWIGDETVPARRLLLDELIPLAREGLRESGCDDTCERYLDIVAARVEKERTGSRWVTRAHDALQGKATSAARLAGIVEAMHALQREGNPVHTWDSPSAAKPRGRHCATVGQLMTTDLFTVHPEELIQLAAHVMDWRHVRHVPVEDDAQRLVGLLSHRILLRELARQATAGEARTTRARDVMETDLATVTPQTSTAHALELMRSRSVSCLPVIDAEGTLVGILTERDLIRIATPLLRDFLERED